MGVIYSFGNLKTNEYIEVGKGTFWNDLFHDLIKKEISIDMIRQYINENWGIKCDKDYIDYVAKNVQKFCEYVGNNLIFKSDEFYQLLDGTYGSCEDLNPPFYYCFGKWTMIWDRYQSNNKCRRNIEL